jgi:CRP-like cAMP-binding protein
MLATEVDRPALTGLRRIALLQGLDDAVLAEVAGVCRFQLVRARQTVMSRADGDRDCCLVLSGRLRVVALSPNGREVSFRDALAGETLGEMAALDGRPRSATVVALQDSLLARIGSAELKGLLQRHWPICERMLQHLARAARELTERVYELSTLGVQQRLCAELLRQALVAEAARATEAAARAGPGPGTDRVVLRELPSHKELAARIATSREQVTRELGDLVRQGVLSHEGEHLVVADVRRLTERIEATPT